MRRQFDEQLEELAREMISMGAMIESAIDKACDALMRHDVALAKSVMEADHLIDQKERTIESMCLRLLLMQQPIARDLRKVSSALKMITDMERIGDQAADICEIVTMMDGMEGLDNPRLMRDMAHETVDMVHKVIDAYVASDVHLAQAVMAADDVVDGILSGTRWTCSSSQNFGTHTVDFTYKNALSCLNQVQETWGLYYRPRLILEDNRVTERHIELLPRLGADVNYRFEWGKNLLEVERVTDSRNIVTALYGRGKTLTLKQLDGQPSRGQRVDFGEVQWSKPGDPADKPLGQLWVGDDEAREAYGYWQGYEQNRHPFG